MIRSVLFDYYPSLCVRSLYHRKTLMTSQLAHCSLAATFRSVCRPWYVLISSTIPPLQFLVAGPGLPFSFRYIDCSYRIEFFFYGISQSESVQGRFLNRVINAIQDSTRSTGHYRYYRHYRHRIKRTRSGNVLLGKRATRVDLLSDPRRCSSWYSLFPKHVTREQSL